MTYPFPLPTVMLWPEETREGTVYHPGNKLAKAVADLLGVKVILPYKLPLIEALGFNVAMHNGQPIPFPKGAYQRPQPEPRHVRDFA